MPNVLTTDMIAHMGALVLHGAAVEIDGTLAVFSGETGAGKSTLSASLHRSGHRLLGDDAVVVTSQGEEFWGEPVYPSLRLYPEAVHELLGEDAEVSKMAHYSDKQRVQLDAPLAPDTSKRPLAAMFFLCGDNPTGQVESHRLTPGEACLAVIRQSFMLNPDDPSHAAARLKEISRLAEQVSAFEIAYPHDFARLDEVHAMIKACIKQAKQPDGKYHHA